MEPVFNSVCRDELCAFMASRRASCSPNTYKNDITYMMSFDRFLCRSGFQGGFLSEKMVVQWISGLPPEISPSTKKSYINVLRKFLRFRSAIGPGSYIPPCPKVPDGYIPYIYTDEEVQQIFQVMDSWPGTAGKGLPYIHIELPMLLRMLASCGLRLGEALAMKRKDIDMAEGILTVRHAKGGKERLVPMHESLRQVLESYCMALGIAGIPDAYIFPRKSFDEPLRNADIGNRFRRATLEKAGIYPNGRKKNERGPCIHSFRHYFTLKSFRQLEQEGFRIGDAVPYLSVYLGHESILETQSYMKFTTEMFPDEMGLFQDYTAGIFPEVDYG